MQSFFKRLTLNSLFLAILLVSLQLYAGATVKADTAKPKAKCHKTIEQKQPTQEIDNNTQSVSLEVLAQNHYDRWQEVNYDFANMEDIYNSLTYPLAKIIFAEAGGSNNDTLQQYVGYVFINLLHSKYYPDTVEGVLKRCYADTTQQRFYEEKFSEKALKNAKIVVNNYYNGTMPVSSALIYQAEFKQGINSFKIDNEFFGYDQRILNDLKYNK